MLSTGCGKPPPPAPTVALAEAARPGATLSRGSQTIALAGERRVEEGAELRTAAGGRASARLDGGSWLLLDEKSAVKLSASRVELLAGRAWIDARDVDTITVAVPGGTLSATQAGFAVETSGGGDKGSRAYCVSGQLTYAATRSDRLESGMAVRIASGGEVKVEPEAQWDDWTGGLAEPGPPRDPEPAAVGTLAARGGGERGQAYAPLLVRRHDVRAEVHRDIAVTDVEQVFFNPRSENVDGLYTLRLPRGAIVAGFEVRDEEQGSSLGRGLGGGVPLRVVAPSEPGAAVGGEALAWAGPDRYRAVVTNLLPGKTRVVHVRYVEWLSRRDGRRTWVYPMGGKAPPLLGEFSLEIDTSDAGAGALEAGMGAVVEGRKVVLRRSDFRPRADFALDLLDGQGEGQSASSGNRPAYRVLGNDGVGSGYVLVPLELPFGAPPSQVDLVLVADVSAGTDPGRLDLERAVVDAVLRQLGPGDRVALLAASTSARPLGAGAPLDKVTPARSEALLEALARTTPGGATDLGRVLEEAAAIAGERGVVVYLGDGQPTVGALLPGGIRERLARLGHPPRLFAVGVGSGSQDDLLAELARGGGIALHVDDRPEAAHAAYRILAAASQPVLRELRFDLGPGVDVVYPAGPLHASAGEPLRLVGRLRGEPPRRLRVTGVRDGQPLTIELPLVAQAVEDGGDVRRRFASARLVDLLDRDAGREAIVEVGTRFGLVTPLTALATSGASSYARVEFDDTPGRYASARAFVPPALRDLPPEDAPIALEEGTSSTLGRGGSVEALYLRAIEGHDDAVRACYDRRAAGHPELSGRVEFSLRIGLGGEILAVKQLASSLRDAQVESCMARALAAMRLPAAPDGRIHDVVRAFQLEQEDGRLGSPGRCSSASRQYLATRRALWRERLAEQSGAEGAINVWRGAERACELRTWLDRRALLDLLRPHAGGVYQQIDLYHRFAGQADVQAHLRREILRAVRTAADLRAIRGGLALDGGIPAELVEAQLAKAPDAAARVKVLRLFLALAPDGVALRVRLMQALEEAATAGGGGPTNPMTNPLMGEARRVAQALRAEPAADVRARQAVGELFARSGDLDEACRAFSEIVELAPFDPWARRRLGDLYLAYGRHDDAWREYETLAWLTPTNPAVPLLLARAAAAGGRTDEALRLAERVAEAVETGAEANGAPAHARALLFRQLSELRLAAESRNDEALLARLASRARADGVLGWAGQGRITLTWQHPDARLELWVTTPGDKEPRRAEAQGGEVGVEAMRLAVVRGAAANETYLLAVRRPRDPHDRTRTFEGELRMDLDPANFHEHVLKVPVRLGPDDAEVRFSVPFVGKPPVAFIPAGTTAMSPAPGGGKAARGAASKPATIRRRGGRARG